MKLRFKVPTKLLVAATIAVSLFAYPFGNTTMAGGTLIYGMADSAAKLDPHATGGWATYRVTYQIFEGLAKEDLTDANASTPKLIPGLATSWDISSDGLSYTFKLRKGVKFHDGTDFDAEAVKFNFDRFWNKSSPDYYEAAGPYVGAYTRWIKDVKVIDDMTVRVTLTEPNHEWLRSGLQSYGQPLMVSPASVKKHGNDKVTLNPVGTGPFKFVEREQGVKIVLARNENYWGSKAKLDTLIFRPLTDDSTRVSALRSGEAHIIYDPPVDELDALKEEGFILTQNDNVPYIEFLHFNHKNPVLKDVRVRQAINHAVDRVGLTKEIFGGTALPAYGMLSRGTFAFNPNEKARYPYDPEKAKALLAAAGYSNGVEISFESPTVAPLLMIEWIQRDLKKVGINVKINRFEWIAYLSRWGGGMSEDVGMNNIAWGMSVPSWTGIVSRCDTFPPNGVNSGWYCNKKVDELLNQAIVTDDKNKSATIYRQVNDLIVEDAAFLPLYHSRQPIVISPNVKGFVNPPEVWFDLSTVEVLN